MLARYEFKYLVPRRHVDAIREVARSFCEPDAYGVGGCYEVNSLYCDTVDLRTARETLVGQKMRFKVRMRTYGFSEADPVFLEMKRRVGTTILKGRALVSRAVARGIAGGDPSPAGGWTPLKASHDPDLTDYLAVTDRLALRPAAWIRYRREAWGSAFSDGARLTFDTFLEAAAPDFARLFEPDPQQWQMVAWEGPSTVLELKFNCAYPKWMHHIVRGFQLQRVSFPKYVQGLLAVRGQPFAHEERGLRGALL
jgi:hypothetical protein